MNIPKSYIMIDNKVGVLTGAEIIAIEQAERYKTDLVIMENGEIVHISPQEMRERLANNKALK